MNNNTVHANTNYLCFTAQEANVKIALVKIGTPDEISLLYSTDGSNWLDYHIGTNVSLSTNITLDNIGDKVYFKATSTNPAFYKIETGDYYCFEIENKVGASGNIMSLLDSTCSSTTVPDYAFYNLFLNTTNLTSAPDLPATTLGKYCYSYMFSNCSSMITAPELPATVMKEGCYNKMFENCTSLTTAPELSAMTLAKGCYEGMFYGCTNLTTTPELPATTLANNCYASMFEACENLTDTPELPATTLASHCYDRMFANCICITASPDLPATTLAKGCYEGMFFDCTDLTTASELPSTTLADNCYDSMFEGCISLLVAPSLPATTLAKECYQYMFYECSSITSAPELSAMALTDGCYNNMFACCTNLTSAPQLPATTLAENCYYNMFDSCTNLVTAPDLPATTLADNCYNGMFSSCEALITAPDLPATTLDSYCYAWMFSGCVSLTTAPDLPATTLADNCYNGMFESCTGLDILEVKNDTHQREWIIPASAIVATDWDTDMFLNSGDNVCFSRSTNPVTLIKGVTYYQKGTGNNNQQGNNPSGNQGNQSNPSGNQGNQSNPSGNAIVNNPTIPAVADTTSSSGWQVGETRSITNAIVTKLSDNTCSFKDKTIHKSTISIPSTITVDGTKYTVVSLKRDCVHGHYVKKLIIPSTVTNFEYACFAGDKHLTNIKINSSKITVAKNLFRNVSMKQRKKIVVTVSKKMSKKNFNALRKALVKQGLKYSNIIYGNKVVSNKSYYGKG